jgi:recombination protein RecT
MEQSVATTSSQSVAKPETGIKSLSSFLNGDQIKAKFTEILGARGTAFIASVLSVCNTSNDLKNATPESIYTAALMAATLDLPINQNLGHAFIIPFKSKAGTPNEKVEAQFQISAKGFKQLAIRSGQYKIITDAIVYEGQLVKEDPLQGFEFDWTKKESDTVIGYVAYFELISGYKSTFYMSKQKVTEHALKYSQTFKSKTQWVKESSKWTTDFDSMALKTVTKLNLSKNGPLSVEMQRAMVVDQAVIKNYDKESDTLDVSYEDNKLPDPVTVEELQQLFDDKAAELTKKEFDDATRIIRDKEQESYVKLKNLLISK